MNAPFGAAGAGALANAPLLGKFPDDGLRRSFVIANEKRSDRALGSLVASRLRCSQ